MKFSDLHRYTVCALLSTSLVSAAMAQGGSAGVDPAAPQAASSSPRAQSGAGAQAGTDAQPGALTQEDREFVRKAAVGSIVTVALGQLAQVLASNEQVKQFSRQIVEDHAKANDELMALAKVKGVQIPLELDHEREALIGRLKSLWGAEFDREYMKAVVVHHKESVPLFEAQATSSRDPDLKAFASKLLPVLLQHLKTAESTLGALADAGSGTGTQGGDTGERGSSTPGS
ncbi:MAG TPA: DUF4142 domain-containing protein [Burkholderiaceae bacterium]|nr:DUF4142 domain-containing protein [Burkholderiaceae bacterium]